MGQYQRTSAGWPVPPRSSYYTGFVKDVTIVLDEEVARWVRIRAAEKATSVSRLVGKLLRQMMKDQQRYEEAWRAFSSIRAKRLRKRGEKLPGRGDLHQRGLR